MRVVNFIAVFGVLGLLSMAAACSERVVYLTPEEVQARKDAAVAASRAHTGVITRQLPKGCEFRDLGNYERPGWSTAYPIFAIFCERTITTGSFYQSGKSMQRTETTVAVGVDPS